MTINSQRGLNKENKPHSENQTLKINEGAIGLRSLDLINSRTNASQLLFQRALPVRMDQLPRDVLFATLAKMTV